MPLGNQSVLLAGVNDCPYIMKKLVQKHGQHRVRLITFISATFPKDFRTSALPWARV
ncbi:MAG: hypothetical protein LRY51_02990 [Geovibrio sp.]|nr:hypothetical protein [Geovibrio sp.]